MDAMTQLPPGQYDVLSTFKESPTSRPAPQLPAMTPEQFVAWLRGFADAVEYRHQRVGPTLVARIFEALERVK